MSKRLEGAGWQYRTAVIRVGYEVTQYFGITDQPRLTDLYDRHFPHEPLSQVLASEPYIAVEKLYVENQDGTVTEVMMLAVHR